MIVWHHNPRCLQMRGQFDRSLLPFFFLVKVMPPKRDTLRQVAALGMLAGLN